MFFSGSGWHGHDVAQLCPFVMCFVLSLINDWAIRRLVYRNCAFQGNRPAGWLIL